MLVKKLKMTIPKTILKVDDLKIHFPIQSGFLKKITGHVRAVDGVTLNMYEKKTLGLVGESGCGKTTLGRAILKLYEITSGKIFFKEKEITKIHGKDLRRLRKQMQMIFQDPYASLNPRMTAGKIVLEPLLIHEENSRYENLTRVNDLFEMVGLNPDYTRRFPHQFSGGQRQRIGIARALALNPSLVICDEAISSLDVSIQAQIINLLLDLQNKLGLSFLFISHDISMIGYFSDYIAVMYLGKIMEYGTRDDIFNETLHPYTHALLSSVPEIDPEKEKIKKRILLKGDLPSTSKQIFGCVFNTRCNKVEDRCFKEAPVWRNHKDNHWVACHFA